MLSKVDKKIKLDIFMTAFATLTSIFFIILSYLQNKYATQILSILIIILPAIYIIGSLIIRGIITQEYSKAIEEVEEGIKEMQEEINSLKRNK